MQSFDDFVPDGAFEESVFAAAKEALEFFVAAGVTVWPILLRKAGS